MKVIVIGTRGIPDIPGGVETHCQELYPRIAALGHDVTVVCRSAYLSEDHPDHHQGVKLKSIFSPKPKSLEAICHSSLAVFWARTQKADVLHIHAIGPALVVPVARLLGLKVVMTNHGPDYDRQKWNRIAKLMLKIGENLGSKFSNSVIVISDVIKNILKDKYGRSDSVLIYNGIARKAPMKKGRYLEELGISSSPYIVLVARFVEEKGFHDLLDAMECSSFPDVKVVFVGDAEHETEYSRSLKARAKKRGVVLTGFIGGDKLAEVFSNSSVFVMPSYHEGLPIALLEAMNYKLPVVVSDIAANKEVGLPSSCYFPVGDCSELSQSIANTLCNDVVPGYSEYLERYDWDDIAVKTVGVYRDVVSG